jgi:AraC-like DNA-binding protein
LEFDAALLDVTQPHFNQRLSEAVSFEASCALARLGGNQRCSSRVRELLSEAWPEVPTMDDLAPKLGMSSRTLRRRLEQEGTAFPVLVAEAQRARALRLLREPHASVKEVAYALGFATPSAFHRAFKRWTGSSPSEARASRASQDPAEEALSSP